MARAFVGTSGFRYAEWKPGFYPADLKEKGFLGYYGTRLDSVEIDSTYYRMPNAKTLDAWAEATPEGFRFALKASRRITHFGRLKVPSEALDYLVGILPRLGAKLGTCLFQLPPTFRANPERLAEFLAVLPVGFPRTFEFRHPSWFTDDVYGLLGAHRAALCIHDADEGTTPAEITGPAVYLRLRRSAYSPEDLEEWAARIRGWVETGHDVYAYLKHEDNPEAPGLALDLHRRTRPA